MNNVLNRIYGLNTFQINLISKYIPSTDPTIIPAALIVPRFIDFSTFLHYLKNNIPLDTVPSFLRIHLANAAARSCVKVSCGICIHTLTAMQEKLDHSYPQDYSLYGVIL